MKKSLNALESIIALRRVFAETQHSISMQGLNKDEAKSCLTQLLLMKSQMNDLIDYIKLKQR